MHPQELLDLMHRAAVEAAIRALIVRGASRKEALYAIIKATDDNDEPELSVEAVIMYEKEVSKH